MNNIIKICERLDDVKRGVAAIECKLDSDRAKKFREEIVYLLRKIEDTVVFEHGRINRES